MMYSTRRGFLGTLLGASGAMKLPTSGNKDCATMNAISPQTESRVDCLCSRASSLESMHTGRYNPIAHGAIWDGKKHPLKERFGSIEEARGVYPHAVSLSDEIDWAATQAAINQIVIDWSNYGEKMGASVVLPPGRGRFNRELTLPYRLIYPGLNQVSVNVVGQGRNATVVDFNENDAPVAGAAIVFREASVEGGCVVWKTAGSDAEEMADVILERFELRGPGQGYHFPAPTSRSDFETKYGFDAGDRWATAYNTSKPLICQLYEKYNGIELPDRVALYDLRINGFHKGIVWHGGQRPIRNIFVENCYYGIYFVRNYAHHGASLIDRCVIGGRFACIALEPSATFFNTIIGSILAGSPFVFYKEALDPQLDDREAVATYGSHWSGFVSGTTIIRTQFENIGHAILAEGNVKRRYECRSVTIESCYFEPEASWTFPASPIGPNGAIPDAARIDCRTVQDFKVLNPHAADLWTPGSVSTFRFDHVEGFTLEQAHLFAAQGAAHGKPVFKIGSATDARSVRTLGNTWSGTLMTTSTAGDANKGIIAGDLVGIYGTRIEQHTASRPGIVGVAVETNPDIKSQNDIMVATEVHGSIDINHEGIPATRHGGTWTYSTSQPGKICEVEAGEALGRFFDMRPRHSSWPCVWTKLPQLTATN